MDGTHVMHIFLASTAGPKRNAVSGAQAKCFSPASRLFCVQTSQHFAPQPVGIDAGFEGAARRLQVLEDIVTAPVLAIESTIVKCDDGNYDDIACILLRDRNRNIELRTLSTSARVPRYAVVEAVAETQANYEFREWGLAVTCGEMIARRHPTINAQDWHTVLLGTSRESLIQKAVVDLFTQYVQCIEKK